MSLSPGKHELPFPSTNKEFDRVTLIEELLDIFNESIEQCFPELDNEFSDLSRLEGLAREKYGDYVCMNILTICEGLRRLDPYLFHQKRTQVIARKLLKVVKKENQKSKIIEKLCLRDVGFLTFRLSPKWMTQRIKKMINAGIDIWAPVLDEESVIINSPTPLPDVEAIRSHYIKEMLSRMLDYSGVSVSTCLVSEKSNESNVVVREYFTKKRGVITSLSDNNHFFEDLQALWSAIYKKRGQLIVYVTSVRHREYVKQCIDVATNEEWLSCEWNPSVCCCGYRTSSVENEYLSRFWKRCPSDSKFASLLALGKQAGYTPKAAFECVIKYTYLKTHRLAECRLFINEMLDEEGNTFLYLLKTRVLISSLSKNSSGRGMVKYTKAFFERERELALHLVQFTEVIEKACLTFLLHPVCIYLCDLCKKFTSYYYEVMEFLDLRTFKFKFFLCDATKVVMEKCFHLLGITPESSRRCLSSALLTDFKAIPRPVCDARPENINPRFEMFCMNVVVADGSFHGWKMHGIVSLVDADGLLSDERLPLNRNEHGHVVYFYREWYDTIGISKNAFVHFESPSPCYIAPFSPALHIYVKVFVTSADKCFQICNLEPPPIKLPEIWVDNKDYMRGTLSFEGNNGRIHIDYIALRDAVDVTMKLSLVSRKYPALKAYVSGCIYAYYGDMLDGLDDLRQSCYKAIVFKADGSEFDAGRVPLKKSCMAVPFNGNLVLEACFYDSSKRVIFRDTCRFPAQTQGRRQWRMALNQNCLLKLTLGWSQGPKSSYC